MATELPALDAVKVGVVGLGYVGLPLAVALARFWPVVGIDVDHERVAKLAAGDDRTGEIERDRVKAAGIDFTTEPTALQGCSVIIIAVPTPVDRSNYPDLGPLIDATRTVASVLQAGGVVVYESTVYPGATEELCIPALEEGSGLRCNQDFWVGYSPERINPGDKERPLESIVKVTSGSTPEAAAFVDAFYRRVILAGTHLAPSIRVAEAAKAVENTQRDVNIAFVNELAMMFKKVGIDTRAVLDAAGTKWNFLPFRPGLVGGHCIGVDPYYLIHKANEVGFHPEIVLAARRVNDGMAEYVVTRLLRTLAKRRISIIGARVLLLGATFKENCSDMRNSQVPKIIEHLEEYGASTLVYDPYLPQTANNEVTSIDITVESFSGGFDMVVLAVPHRQFLEWGDEGCRRFLRPGGVFFDLRGFFDSTPVDHRL